MSGFTLPSISLLSQSILSGVFVGALYGLMGLGLHRRDRSQQDRYCYKGLAERTGAFHGM